MKIIQIVLNGDTIIGLGDDGNLYTWNTMINNWSPYA